MDDYVKIQSIFSDFYFNDLKKRMKTFDKMRNQIVFGWVVATIFLLSMVVFIFADKYFEPFVDKLFLNCILMVTFSIFIANIFFSKYSFRNIDRLMKEELMPMICDKLSPVITLRWYNFVLSIDEFCELFQKHNIIKVNKTSLQLDDRFEGTFHDVDFKIFEVFNQYVWFIQIVVCFFYLLISMFLAYIANAAIAGLLLPFWGANSPFMLSFYRQQYSYYACVIFIFCLFCSVNNTISGGTAFNLLLNILESFKGIIVEFDIKKKFKGHTIIFGNDEENFFVKKFLTLAYEKVELEDVEFNKKFSVYTTDQIEARYLLTTKFMDKLKNLKHNYSSKYIRASFKDGNLVLAIQSNKDLFRVGSVWHKTNPKMYQAMFLELISILQIIDTLNLDSNTGL